MCRPEFENGGLRERPHTEKMGGGLSERPLTENRGGFGTKNNKETYIFKRRIFWSSPGRKSGTNKCIFLKRGSFGAVQVEKVESLGEAQADKTGVFRSGTGRKMQAFRAAHTRTALIWEYPPPGQTDKERKTKETSLINDLCLPDR